jgi:hypothetical protein
VGVDVRRDRVLYGREHVLDQGAAAGHPLVVGTAAVVVRPVDLGPWEALGQPAEQRLVARVHAQRHLRLPSVAAEAALADEHADEDAPVQLAEPIPFHV